MQHNFQIFQNAIGFIALADDGNCGYGSSVDEAIADLQLAYDDADFEVYDFVFEAE